ncbi:MAG: 16S rRNA (guanine(966)-N(2))-methyltransferase RsmD [Thermodesulfobacteriota bacterium]
MRIIAGTAKGRNLSPIKGKGIRPTSDKIRQAIFNILNLDWDGTRVLDLFAGTGALGIEALSRGASEAVFVDHHPYAIETIKKNLLLCGFSEKGRVFQKNPLHGLGFLEKPGLLFDVIFMDPPYGQGMARKMLELLARRNLMKPDGVVVVECDRAEQLSSPAGFQAQGEKRVYGRTTVYFFEKEGREEAGG